MNEHEQRIADCLAKLNQMDEPKFQHLLKIATAYRRLNKLREALYYTQQAIMEANTENEFALCHWQLGIIYKHLGNKTKSMKFYNRALTYYQEKGDLFRTAEIYKNMSRAVNSIRLAKEAIRVLLIAKKINNSIKDCLVWDYYDNLHDIYVMAGQYSDAFKALENIEDNELKTKLMMKLTYLIQNR